MNRDYVKTVEYKVRVAEMDEHYLLTPCQLIGYFQDAMASDYADNGVAAFHLEEQGLIWILSEMSIHFESEMPFWREQVVIKTWNSKVKGFRVIRDFIALNDKGDIIASGTSTWFIINQENMKPVPLDDFKNALPESNAPDEIKPGIEIKKPSVESLKIGTADVDELLQKVGFLREPYYKGQSKWALKKQARSSDIDFNGHVNNLRYVAGALETIPPEIRSELYLESIYVKFTAEAKLDDDVSSLCVMDGEEKRFTHLLLSRDGSVQYSSMESKWRKR